MLEPDIKVRHIYFNCVRKNSNLATDYVLRDIKLKGNSQCNHTWKAFQPEHEIIDHVVHSFYFGGGGQGQEWGVVVPKPKILQRDTLILISTCIANRILAGYVKYNKLL